MVVIGIGIELRLAGFEGRSALHYTTAPHSTTYDNMKDARTMNDRRLFKDHEFEQN